MAIAASTQAGRESDDRERPRALSEGSSASADTTSERESDDADGVPQTGQAPVKKKKSWRMAPVRWWGSLEEQLRWSGSDSQPDQFGATHMVSLNARSFIRAPWYALVRGHLNLALTSEETAKDAAVNAKESESTSVTGGVGLDLFPQSRFPFSASLDVTDSQTSNETAGSAYKSTRVKLRQNYRPVRGSDRYSLSYDWSLLESEDSVGDDVLHVLSASHTRVAAPHTFSTEGNLSWNDKDGSVETSTRVFNASLHHTWRPDKPYSFDNIASINDSLQRVQEKETQSRFLQLSSNVGWTPATERPMHVNAGARVFAIDGNLNDDQGMISILALSAGLGYQWTPHVNASASMAVIHNSGDAGDLTSASQSASVNYSPELITLGKFSYNWSTGANLSNQWSSNTDSVRILGVNIGHGLTRSWPLTDSSTLSAGISQSADAGVSSLAASNDENATADADGGGSRVSRGFTNGANLTLTFSPADQASMNFSLNASDSRSWGSTSSHFQMLNALISGQLRMSRYTMLTANLSLQSTRQLSPLTQAEEADEQAGEDRYSETSSAYGTLSLFNSRLLGVKNLSYALNFSANTLGLDKTREEGNADAPRETIDKSLEQRVDYHIGRMNVSLSHRIVETSGATSSSLFLRIARAIGAP